MQKVIHKQVISLRAIDDVVSLSMPNGAEILSVGNQHESMVVWYLFNESEKEYVQRYFRIAGTGHKINLTDGFTFEYVGTVMLHEGRLVFHVFEIEEAPF